MSNKFPDKIFLTDSFDDGIRYWVDERESEDDGEYTLKETVDKEREEILKPIRDVSKKEIRLVEGSFCNFHLVKHGFIQDYITKLEKAIKETFEIAGKK